MMMLIPAALDCLELFIVLLADSFGTVEDCCAVHAAILFCRVFCIPFIMDDAAFLIIIVVDVNVHCLFELS